MLLSYSYAASVFKPKFSHLNLFWITFPDISQIINELIDKYIYFILLYSVTFYSEGNMWLSVLYDQFEGCLIIVSKFSKSPVFLLAWKCPCTQFSVIRMVDK